MSEAAMRLNVGVQALAAFITPDRRGERRLKPALQLSVTPAILLMALSSEAAQPITTESLLAEMTNRDALARFPSPAYRSVQTSSYDRASKKPGTDDWTANRDYSQFLGTEITGGRTEHVMMRADGPGAIVRIWLTWAGRSGKPFSDGTIRLYLDDADEPVVTAKASQFIDGGPDGTAGKLGGEPFAYGVSPKTPHARRGHNLFVPIPFAKSCQLTYETDQAIAPGGRIDESFYYHVGYRLYESGTTVETFTLDRWHKLLEARNKAAARLKNQNTLPVAGGPASKGRPGRGAVALPGRYRVRPSRKRKGVEDEWHWQLPGGPRAIRLIRLDASKLAPQALRSTLLAISFDDQETVRVPVEGFFTCGYRPHAFETWMHACSDDKMLECRFVMPYSKSATVKLITLDSQIMVEPELEVFTSPWSWDDRSMYFHADWRTDRDLSTGIAKTQDNRRGVVDLDFLTAKGQGVLVGDSITLFSGAARWWGEGDEKISVDGEEFPSHFGTGTEDYYGYAWCRPETFSMPFHAQPVGRGALLGGLVVNTRLRSLDAIPFRQSIDFDIELWHWSATQVNYARTVFWYAVPGATSQGSTIELAGQPVALKDTDITVATKITDAAEGESARVIEITGGEVTVDRYTLFGWSGGAQLLWKDARPGNRLVLEFDRWPENAAELIYTIGPDYGAAQVQIGQAEASIQGRFIGVISVLETRRKKLDAIDRERPIRMTVTMKGDGDHARRFGLDAIVPAP